MRFTHRALVSHFGRHRAPRIPFPAGVFAQAFRHCPPCGVETAAVLHTDGSHTCTEGHTTRGAQ
jgi:hypothetical protein